MATKFTIAVEEKRITGTALYLVYRACTFSKKEISRTLIRKHPKTSFIAAESGNNVLVLIKKEAETLRFDVKIGRKGRQVMFDVCENHPVISVVEDWSHKLAKLLKKDSEPFTYNLDLNTDKVELFQGSQTISPMLRVLLLYKELKEDDKETFLKIITTGMDNLQEKKTPSVEVPVDAKAKWEKDKHLAKWAEIIKDHDEQFAKRQWLAKHLS